MSTTQLQPESSVPVPPKTERRAPRRKSSKPRSSAKSGATAKSAAAVPSAQLRSKVAITKLQDAIEQLEQVLRTPPPTVAEVGLPGTPESGDPVLPPRETAPLVVDDDWTRAIRPALATCVFLVVVGALAFGYNIGYSAGGDAVAGTMTTVASAAERPLPSPEATPTEISTRPLAEPPTRAETEKPSPLTQPATPQPSLPTASGLLHLQVSALKSPQAAKRLGQKLESEGFPVQVREPGADGLVRVLVGPVDDREQLAAMADRLREEGLKPFPKRL